MQTLDINGVTVQFPFTPYECQKDYMGKVIECLQRGVNGVLESPTGTGKTLCLLCATLAWRDNFKDTIAAHKIAERLNGKEMFPSNPLSSWGQANTDGSTPTYFSDVPKIIYASRTHSQLTQVVNELKNTSYKPKVCILGSREQLCIHPEVMRQESNHVKVHMCRGKVSTRSCVFYNNVEEKSTDRDLVNNIVDIEDLVKFGNKQRACPYYLSRSLKQQADVIFMPYNYLLDPKSRKAHSIELTGSVVIFDEAHNIEKTCEESTSFDMTPYDLASAINALTRLLGDQAKEANFGESSVQGLKTDIETVVKIKEIFLNLEAALDSFEVPADRGITKPGIFIYELLERAKLNYNTKTDVFEALEQIIGYLAGQPGIFLNTSGLQKLSDIIQLVFSGEVSSSPSDRQKKMEANTAHFKVHIHQDTSSQKKQTNTDPWASSSTKKAGNILSYWCFSPGFSMQELVNQGVRCIILTSGTLSPLSSFTSEMRIKFPVSLENSHVIERDQIFVSIIERGPDGVPLSSAFDRRFVPENLSSLGNTVVNLTRIVPHGLLLFFPSFFLMEKTLEFWRGNGHADRIESVKPMFIEPKGKGTFTEAIGSYYHAVNDSKSRGGIFSAVCRGKASEGLDFANTFGRGVIITGLPFPPKMDPRVVLKMQFLDEMNQRKIPGMKFLSGQEWYKEQAFRAVNQAIGRVIRHKDDYGAIFLCDQRFKNRDAQSHLPSWVRPYVRPYDNFGNIVRDVCQFFRVAQKMRPVLQKNTAPELASVCSAGNSQLPFPQSSGSSSYLVSQSTYTQKAKMLDTHTSTLKRRRTDEDTAVAGIFKQYESQTTKTKIKPGNLFDALERVENRREKNDALGDQTQSNSSTLSLQYDKRMDEMMRGGKRKIKLVQEQKTSVSTAVSGDGKNNMARKFLGEMKSSLSQVNFEKIRLALHSYKKNDNLDTLLSETSLLTDDPHTYSLLRGLYPFVRPHHRKRFDEKCQELTGTGCGYKPEHSLCKDEKKSGMPHGDVKPGGVSASGSTLTSTSSQLNGDQFSRGGHQELRETQTDLNTKSLVQAAFLADVKKALGAEGSAQLCQAVHSYKTTDNYENMVTAAVSLFTEKDEDFSLLIRFANIIRPHHKKQYKAMLRALMGQSAETAAEKNDENESGYYILKVTCNPPCFTLAAPGLDTGSSQSESRAPTTRPKSRTVDRVFSATLKAQRMRFTNVHFHSLTGLYP
ncbi:regulator of telomere elongation helicase 1 isoform X2 [Dunckerocampus dactyliophorus]|uniref:regulator of telomere elongation helicase 1 isoform X2 n=1 Tax=Dunckerocampus dactyliophorus TaxID=161453 RepID=UPI0024053AF6|nr:regulator of telomere elongation helicase 1 isoform X2 [Dunckerocampus dactyliophorus]